MNRVFKPRGFFTVPDKTEVSPFLNATDTMQEDVPWGALGDISIAAGRIKAGVHSSVHVHPVVTQVTYVVAGNLTVRMQATADAGYYDLILKSGQAVITEPGTAFQLRNDSGATVRVLYIVSPPYVFEMKGDKVVYDDAVVVAEKWEGFAVASSDFSRVATQTPQVRAKRDDSLQRLKRGKGPEGGAKA